jgi:ABC-type multidrug transport system fused ATPase/permease subunit
MPRTYLTNPPQFFYGRYLKKLSNRTQESLGEMSSTAQEALSAMRTVQAYNAMPVEENKFNKKVQNVFELAKKEAYATALFYGSSLPWNVLRL